MSDHHQHPHRDMHPHRRNTDRILPHAAGEILIPERRGGDRPEGHHKVTTLYSGDYHVTNSQEEMIVTILGSCVAACMHDPVAKVGGMNHFLLPDSGSADGGLTESTRYGAFAMEQLINGIIKMGGLKSRLEVKLFGGANVINNSSMIGSKNVAFVKRFMKQEGLAIAGHDLGQDYPRRLRYYPATGKVMLLKLRRKEDMAVIEEEEKFAKTLKNKPIEGGIELF